MLALFLAAVVSITTLAASISFAADVESRIQALEETLKKQQTMIDEQQQVINQLKKELSTTKAVETASQETVQAGETARQPGTPAIKPSQASAFEGWPALSGLFGGSFMSNPYISFVLNTNFYASSIDERKLENRGITGFSTQGFEQKKGFNLQEGELFLFAPVDPYFNLYVTIPFTENGGSIEEAYFYTTALPEGLQAKGGKFKSNFSRFNAQHPHAWDFADPPLAYRAFFGGEGISEKGAQLTYLPALPFYTLLGAEVLQGENPVLFKKDSRGGPHAFTAYAKASFDFGESSTVLFGPYAITGQTRTDTVAAGTFFRGNSTVYGFEAVYKWKPSRTRSLIVQGEYLQRRQDGDLDNVELASTDRFTRSQDGMYVQSLYQMGRWRVGARYDRLALFGDTFKQAGVQQNFHNPWRATGAVEFNPSEFSRLRLQYNYDRSGGNGAAYGGPSTRTNHEVFLQLILGIGAHAAHAF